jgi:hypothetical protein
MEGLEVGDGELEDISLLELGVSGGILPHRLEQNPLQLIETVIDSGPPSFLHYRLITLLKMKTHKILARADTHLGIGMALVKKGIIIIKRST